MKLSSKLMILFLLKVFIFIFTKQALCQTKLSDRDPRSPMYRTAYKATLANYDFSKIMDLKTAERILKQAEGSTPNTDAIKAGWDSATEVLDISSQVGTFAEEAIKISSIKNLNNLAGNIGNGIAAMQISYHIYQGEQKEAAVLTAKTLYNYGISKWGTSALKIASIAVFVIDYSLDKLIETAVTGSYQKNEIAYREYYRKVVKVKRSAPEWYNVVYNIVKNTKDMNKVGEAVEKEVNRYVNLAWNDETELAAFYKSFGAAGGLNEKVRKQISQNHKARIYNEILIPLVIPRLNINLYHEQRDALFKEYVRVADALNKKHKASVTVKPQKSGTDVSNLTVQVLTKRNQEFWRGKTDKSGKWSVDFTTLGWINAGSPNRVRLIRNDGSHMDQPLNINVTFVLKEEKITVNQSGFPSGTSWVSGRIVRDSKGNYTKRKITSVGWRWNFRNDGVVIIKNYWKGTWKLQGQSYQINLPYPPNKMPIGIKSTSFQIRFSPDGKEFIGYDKGAPFIYGKRVK